MKKELISLVVPCYNEEEAIPLFYEAIKKQIKKMDYVDFEVIFVNDGSKDKTLEMFLFQEILEKKLLCMQDFKQVKEIM